MNVLVVGGTWDNDGGKPSSLINKLFVASQVDCDGAYEVYNGGFFYDLETILHEEAKGYDVIIWMANVPNDYDKIRDVKHYNPHCLLVMSKRNDGKYEFKELIKRALDQKANLVLQFEKADGLFKMMLFDPLGNVWAKADDADVICKALFNRLTFLHGAVRIGTTSMGTAHHTEELDSFVEFVKETGETFHKLLNPAPTTRFLGNASFNTRCLKGFPSFKDNKLVYVSRRNVAKETMTLEDFVPVMRIDDKVICGGDSKPSVDTPIQLALYEAMPEIAFMVHGHVYIEGAPMTSACISCGDFREVAEVLVTLQEAHGTAVKSIESFAINLMGHGCIIGGRNVEQLKAHNFIARPMPEEMQMDQQNVPSIHSLKDIQRAWTKFPDGTWGNKYYIPSCRFGYDDCVCDPEYIKAHHQDWYEEMTKDGDNLKGCPGCENADGYDDEDK